MKKLTLLFLLLSSLAYAADKPNVLFILSDDQSWTDYGFMGHPEIKTPHIDKLASESVVFKRGYVPTALCRPSLMSFATGHYASTHGVTGNDPSRNYWPNGSDEQHVKRAELITFIEKFDTLPELLAEAGYLSHQSGKWWEGSYKHGGFTHGMTRGFPEKGGRAGDDGWKIGREGLEPCKEFIDMAVAKDKPFYMWYAPLLPHSPHNPPDRLLNKYKDKHPLTIAKYYAMCELFDETCGELIGYFEKKGIRDNTLIVYISDNGWIQDPESRQFVARSKQTAYEGGVRQPMMFSWPGKLKPQDRKELVLSLDIFPTILAATGARQPKKKLPGINLLPYMEDKKEIPRKAIFGESFAHDIADLQDYEKTLLYRWCIQGKWKLLLTYDGEVVRFPDIHARTEKRPQLFDLMKDPHELKNLAAENPKIVAKMVKQIDGWYPVKRAKTVKVFE
ncbi:MAG: sulfatase [Verrucomicrobia bacterium]|nr:sulfatase [Verrucomicrobiota bacterium]